MNNTFLLLLFKSVSKKNHEQIITKILFQLCNKFNKKPSKNYKPLGWRFIQKIGQNYERWSKKHNTLIKNIANEKCKENNKQSHASQCLQQVAQAGRVHSKSNSIHSCMEPTWFSHPLSVRRLSQRRIPQKYSVTFYHRQLIPHHQVIFLLSDSSPGT